MIIIFTLLALRILPFEIAHFLSAVVLRLLTVIIRDSHGKRTARTGSSESGNLRKAAFNLTLMARTGTPLTRALAHSAFIEGEDNVRRLRDQGKAGVIGLFHYGPWELLPEIFTEKGYSIGAVVSAQKTRLLALYLRALRRRAGLREISDLGTAFTALREGIFVAVLFDKTRRAKDASIDLPYPGYGISMVPFRLSERSRKPLIPIACGFKERKLWIKVGSPGTDVRNFFEPIFHANPSEWISWGD